MALPLFYHQASPHTYQESLHLAGENYYKLKLENPLTKLFNGNISSPGANLWNKNFQLILLHLNFSENEKEDTRMRQGRWERLRGKRGN